MLNAQQRAAVAAALDAATASLKSLQALLEVLQPDLVDEADPPPPWWQALGLSDPDGRP